MKRKYSYRAGGKVVEKEYNYIPVRYIIAILITVLEVAAIIGIMVALCNYVPYFISWPGRQKSRASSELLRRTIIRIIKYRGCCLS